MNIEEKNINTIINCIKKGGKGGCSDRVGVEIEHFITDKNGDCVNYSEGVEQIMERLAPYFDEKVYSEGFLIGLSCDNYHITLEPGAQLEISIKPVLSIAEIESIYTGFSELIEPILKDREYSLTTLGYMPKGRAADRELIPKKRYEFMDKYFKTSGRCGMNMMRATASVQVSVDFKNEEDCCARFALANALSPVFALICDNSPVFEGKPYIGNILRSYIWNNVDNERCRLPFEAGSLTFRKYAEYVYSSPAILVPDKDTMRFTGGEKISDIYADTLIGEEEAEHLLSMFFPDVRLKQYIEIRPADSMPIKYALSYAALVKGVFASKQIFDFTSVTNEKILAAKKQISLMGFDAMVYGRPIGDIAQQLYTAAYDALSEADRVYLEPVREIIYSRQTLKERFNLAES